MLGKRWIWMSVGLVLALAGGAWAVGQAGDLDTGYGSSGVADGGDFWVYDAVTLSDGSVVLGGQDRSVSPFHYAVKKLSADGSIDTGFGIGGIADVLGTVGWEQAQLNTLAVGPDDVIFVGGVRILQVNKKGKTVTYVTTGSVLALDPDDGDVVTAFGSSGYVDTDGTVQDIAVAGTSLAYDLTIATVPVVSVTTSSSGGKGKKGGGSTTVTSQTVGLVRVDQDGSADASFGSGGVVIEDATPDDNAVARTLEIDGFGRTLVYVTQSSRSTNTDYNYIARYDVYGDLDTSYGSSGRLDVTGLGTVTDIAIDGDGESVVVAAHDGTSDAHEPAVVRYDADGSATPDTTFDVPALTVGGSGGSSDTWTLDLVLDASDRVCVGLWFGSSSSNFTVVRCNADGTRDETFGPDGDGIATVADLATSDQPKVLTQGTDGNLIVASLVDTGSGIQTRVVRWLGN